MFITYETLLKLKINGKIVPDNIYFTDKGIFQGTKDKKINLYSDSIKGNNLSALKNDTRDCIAGEDINGGFLLVYLDSKVYRFDASNEAHYGRCIGFANQSGKLGEIIKIISYGECYQLGSLTPGIIYYASSYPGLITSTLPTTGILQKVGISKDSSTIIISIEQPIILN